VLTVPGFKPHNEYYLDHDIRDTAGGTVPFNENLLGAKNYQRIADLPGIWIPALLYEPEKLAGKVPVVMNVHGHSGPIGKAELPQQIRCINQAKRGILAMNVDWIGMGQLGAAGFGHRCMNQRRQGDSLRGRDQDPGATAGRSAGQERELQQPGFGAGQEPAPRARAAQGQALGPEVARSETCGARRDCQGQAVRRRADQVRQPVAASIFTC
jgi:hypothetical protein